MLADAGVISGYDITLEAATAKLMYLLGSGMPAEDIKRYLGISMVGEMSD